MENHDGEARHHRLTEGDPGDEQPEVVFIATNPEEQPLADELTRIAAWSKKNLTPIMDAAPVEVPEWLKDNPHPDLPETCYTKEECSQRIRSGGPISCRRQPSCSS